MGATLHKRQPQLPLNTRTLELREEPPGSRDEGVSILCTVDSKELTSLRGVAALRMAGCWGTSGLCTGMPAASSPQQCKPSCLQPRWSPAGARPRGEPLLWTLARRPALCPVVPVGKAVLQARGLPALVYPVLCPGWALSAVRLDTFHLQTPSRAA